MASLNTNTMNFGIVDRTSGQVLMILSLRTPSPCYRISARLWRRMGVKPEIECYDMGGLDNTLLIGKQGIFSDPMNFNFVWGVAGGQHFRPETFIAMMNALPDGANFTTCGVGTEQIPAVTCRA